jgi:DNA-binding IclR family transcriptional regulator
MAASPGQAFTLSELVRRTGVNVASCHAILNVLTAKGHLARHPANKGYRLAPAMAAIGAATEIGDPLLASARSAAAEIAERTGFEVLLTARAGADIVGVARSAASRAPSASMRVGQRVPLTPPYGAIFMAWASEADRAAWVDPAGADAARRAAHMAVLAQVRARGFQVTLRTPVQGELTRAFAAHDEIDDPSQVKALLAALTPELYQPEAFGADERYGVDIVSAPIFDAHADVALALSIYAAGRSLLGRDVLELGDDLARLCRNVSREHGALPSADQA